MRKITRTVRTTCLLSFLLLIVQIASAQTGVIKGTVKDAGGSPLAGASIMVEGKRAGTATDANGNYSLALAPGIYTLVITYVGQTPLRQQVEIRAGSRIEQPFVFAGTADLNGIVVVGSRSRDLRTRLLTPVPVDVIRTKDIKPFAQS